MKIIHTADLHLGSKLTSNLPLEKAKARRLELLSNFSRLLKVAREKNVSLVVIAGDLFDTKRITKLVASEVVSTLQNFSDITVLYVVGNHENSALKDVVDVLPANLICVTQTEWQTFNFSDVVVTGANLNGSNAKMLYNTLMLDKNKKNIVVLHGEIAKHRSSMVGEKINLPELKDKFIDYLALGHYHSFDTDNLDDRGVYAYSGCLEGRGFDELGEKGYVLIDTDDIKNPQFVPFAKRELREVVVDVTGLNSWGEIKFAIQERIKDAPSKDLIKLVIQGKFDYNTETLIYIEDLVRQLNSQFYFAKVDDETEIAYNASDLVVSTGLKAEFVKQLDADNDLSEHDKSEVLQLGLKALKGEDL